MKQPATLAAVLTSALLLSGCAGDPRLGVGAQAPAAAPGTSAGTSAGSSAPPAGLPQGGDPVTPDPADFSTAIDNPYYPLKPGSRWLYRETGGEGPVDNEITVTRDTKKIQGVDTVVVHDSATQGGEPVEDTYDWYAQDKAGNVWYFGEAVKNYQDGKLTDTEGSWEAGVDGAYAGVIMPAHPETGATYRQEYYLGHAQDSAQVLGTGQSVSVPAGSYTGAVKTRDTTPLKPEVEEKFYAPGVGLVQLTTVSGGSDKAELVEYTQG